MSVITNIENNPNKIIVFDLDETLGYFKELSLFWECLKDYFRMNCDYKLMQREFNAILDLYPEFIRPNMFQILEYIKYKKETNRCHKIMIYTNNTGGPEWTHMIKNYFERKMQRSTNNHNHKQHVNVIFDQIIQAFMIGGKHIERLRTSHDKSQSDLIRCTQLPQNTEVFFMDDKVHSEMCNDSIYYINLKPYVYDLQFSNLIARFLKSTSTTNRALHEMIAEDEYDFKSDMLGRMNEYHYKYVKKPMIEYEMDKIISKKIMHHLNIFFTKKLSDRMEHMIVVNNDNDSKFVKTAHTRYKKGRRNNKTKKKNKY